MSRPIGVFDLETTGTDVETDHIVTAFFGVLNGDGSLRFGWDLMVKPEGWTIPTEASDIHGVTTEHALEHGTHTTEEVLTKLGSLIRLYCYEQRLPLVGHNLSYDLTLFDREALRTFPNRPSRSVARLLENVNILDTLVLDKGVDPYRKGKRTLTVTAEHYGVELTAEEAHGARADAIASGRILQALIPLPEVGGQSLIRLQELQREWKREQAASLQKYLRTKADPPIPDAIVDPNWPFIPRAVEEGQYE